MVRLVNDAEMVAAVLYQTPDPVSIADALADLLLAGNVDARATQALGLDHTLVAALVQALPKDPHLVRLACAGGAGWLLGRRSAPPPDAWELVASLPSDVQLPFGLRRTTGETLVALVSDAERTLRLIAPYVDKIGLGVLADVVASATRRGVQVEVFQQSRWGKSELGAVEMLRVAVGKSGDRNLLQVVRLSGDAPFAHLKVVVADGRIAYIGSANITAAALMGKNIELGVLLHGPDVAVIERLFALYGRT